jgi:hypothetical protein
LRDFSAPSEHFLWKELSHVLLEFLAGDMEHLQRTAALAMSLGLGSTTQGYVSPFLIFDLHYLSSPSEHFLQKELSQLFAPIPGAGHAPMRE